MLPDKIFVRASEVSASDSHTHSSTGLHILPPEYMSIKHPIYEQDEELLKGWVDPHKLKKNREHLV
jgi:hypothetical protein